MSGEALKHQYQLVHLLDSGWASHGNGWSVSHYSIVEVDSEDSSHQLSTYCMLQCEGLSVSGEALRQDKTNSLFPRVVNKHTSAFLHSALAQRGTNLLRIHIANTK